MMGFCRLVDGESHQFSANILSEDLTNCFIHVLLQTVLGECRVEEGKGFNFFFEVNPLGGVLRQHLAEVVDVGGC